MGTEDGISIPTSYTSFLGPIQSSKLYNEVRTCREKDKPYYTPFEMSYVVHFRNRMELAPPQALFTFVHPNRGIDSEFLGQRTRSYFFLSRPCLS